MQQNPDDSFNVWKKPQLWCWSKVMLGDKLIIANIGVGGEYYITHFYSLHFVFPYLINQLSKQLMQN